MSTVRAPVADQYATLFPFVTAMAARAGISNVVWTNQTGPSPTPPCAIIQINHEQQTGLAEERYIDDGTFIVMTPVSFELVIDVYGPAAFGAASTMRLASSAPTVRALASPWSIAIRQPIVDVSALLDKTFKQPRARFILLMQGGLQLTDDVGYIATAPIDCGCGRDTDTDTDTDTKVWSGMSGEALT